MTDAIPAATLVLFRDREHLFVERAATMAFAAGALVFPGGRVDAGDHDLAQRFPHLAPDDAAARIAAVRETVEEAGIAIGVNNATDQDMVARLRRHLTDGVPFADALGALGFTLDLDQLVPFARWRPNFKESRTFDTRFFIAQMPEHAADGSVDETENVHMFWASAQAVLDKADAGQARVIFPTRRNLERLATFADFAAARDQANAIAPDTVTPWVEDRDGTTYLCIPEDRGYPITAEAIDTAMRG
jgi:8-oxo-dGTP pyrophosphatase MutT (NUDIX family)